ncbi:hypothetical protein [uncultured Clostridium sp.]|uniref:hypothetical protein n=1 Tax=uncultured Clostridium sp. TaxID=59620 RepID=UPI002597BBFC|nr:hypothetical protein [uncultured Clostridium sp.]
MNWILDETIYNLKSRISALEKVINNEEVNRIYKMSKVEEIKFLKEILQEIDEMMQEEVRDLEEADEDIRTLKTDATMGI